jgi:Zn-dependent protease
MTVEEKVIFFGCLFVAIILHEISHGVVALFFGDDTAKRSGRLTLNPIRHIDPFGSLILPAMLVVAGQGAFGWAKPVPVDPSKLRNPRRQMLFVGLAGPITNFVLMLIAAVTCRTMLQRWLADNPVRLAIGLTLTDMPSVIQIAFYFALANLLLGVLNLLPIPPLDGSSLIERALPRPWLPAWYRFRPYGLLVLFVLVFWTGLFGTILRPFEDALIHYVGLP